VTRGILLLVCLAAASAQTVQIIPRPAVVRNLKGSFQVDRSTVIYADAGSQPVAQWFADQLRSEFGLAVGLTTESFQKSAFHFLGSESLGDEGYRLRIDAHGVVIQGRPAGLFYGAQSVLQRFSASS